MYRLLLILIFPTLLFARKSPPHTQAHLEYIPWLSGTFLSPTPTNPDKGHPELEFFVTAFNFYGEYDSNWKINDVDDTWTISPGLDFQTAFTTNTGLEVIASTVTNFQQGKTSTQFEDTTLLLGYQISNNQADSWVPDCRLTFNTVFPTGSHDNLDPTLNGLDSSGQGAYFFGPVLTFRKLFHPKNHYFFLHWSLGYLFPLRADIRGVSVYGGTPATKGSVIPGQTFIGFISGEYTFTQNWVFAFDTEYLFQFASRDFKGQPGINPNGTPAQIGLPASFELGVTLGLEYSFSEDIALLFGTWFTLAGFNTNAFASAFLSYYFTF